MRILTVEPPWHPGSGRYQEVTRFSAEISPDVRFYSLRLMEDAAGNKMVLAPDTARGRSATFSAELAKALTELICNHLNLNGSNTLNEKHAA